MNRTMPNKKQIPRVGTKLPQKPMPKQDKKNATICIFEPPLCADYSRETRVKFVNPLCNGATDQDTYKSLFLGKRLSVCHT